MPPNHPDEDRHITACRRRLAHLHGLSQKCRAADQAILDAAQQRLTAFSSDVEKLRTRAVQDPKIGQQYTDMLTERGRLMLIVAQAESRLA